MDGTIMRGYFFLPFSIGLSRFKISQINVLEVEKCREEEERERERETNRKRKRDEQEETQNV